MLRAAVACSPPVVVAVFAALVVLFRRRRLSPLRCVPRAVVFPPLPAPADPLRLSLPSPLFPSLLAASVPLRSAHLATIVAIVSVSARRSRVFSPPFLFFFFFAPINKMAQRRGILGLSDAVLGMICSQFCPHCVGEDCLGGFELPGSFGGPAYFGTLVALTQVNVRIGRLAQAARLHLFCARRDSLPLLVRSLVENPALAAHIRVVRLGDCDRDSNHGCILRDLASPQIIEGLKTLVAAELGADIDLSSAEGEQRLLAAFEQLPQPEDCSPVALVSLQPGETDTKQRAW